MIANSWRREEPSGRKEAHASGLMDSKQLYMVKWKETPLESFKNQIFDVEKSAPRSGPDLGKGWTCLGTVSGHIFPECPCKQKRIGPQQEKELEVPCCSNKLQMGLHLASAHTSKRPT